jgi:hypothetical protein
VLSESLHCPDQALLTVFYVNINNPNTDESNALFNLRLGRIKSQDFCSILHYQILETTAEDLHRPEK